MQPATIITTLTERLQQIPGVEAVVLGGSRARGTHTPASDIDIGLYYHPATPPDLAALSRLAAEMDDEQRADLITPIGGWGPWINGGGWLKVAGVPVDFLYRDLEKVTHHIEACCAGKLTVEYQPGHPFAFTSHIYLSEVALCQPLWDPHGALVRLKSMVQPYPSALKRKVVEAFWWEVDFSLQIAHKSTARGDVTYAAGCCFRAVTCLMQTLFALNDEYWMNEKGAVAIADRFTFAPVNLKARVEMAFTQLDASAEGIEAALDILHTLVDECRGLVAAGK